MKTYLRLPVFLVLVISFILAGCNAPSTRIRPTSVLSEESLLKTAEAILEGTSTASNTPDLDAIETPGQGAIWPTLIPTADGPYSAYWTLAGDTVEGLAGRFNVELEVLQSASSQQLEGLLPTNVHLLIPNEVITQSSAQRLLPDQELVYSNTANDFDIEHEIHAAGGYVAEHEELVEDEILLTGIEIVQRVASELSVNPRLLLALLEYQSGWLYGHPTRAEEERYPIGFRIPDRQGLFEELKITATQLNLAYYGWREGSFTTLQFEDGTTMRLDPTLNAGTVALMHLFALLSTPLDWEDHVYSPYGFPVRYFNIFGDPWSRADQMEDWIPANLRQPELALPFPPQEGWSLTAGPHPAWNTGTPLGALDFSPITLEEPCEDSSAWVTASANGTVVRAKDNVVALDLDGDGDEGSGWVVVYYHIATQNMIPEGTAVAIDQRLGHPSCEGGTASGTHVHVSRKFNGEWIAADGPIPMILSGWRAVAGERVYQGELVRGDAVVTADPAGRAGSTIIR